MSLYLVAGAGRSGVSSAKMLLRLGHSVVLYDGKESFDREKLIGDIGEGAERAEIVLGDAAKLDYSKIDVCVTSPGVPLDSPVLGTAIKNNIPVWSEIELAWRHDKGRVIGITGTNGKTTTTSLTYEIIKRWNEKAFLVGNIEIPYTGYALDTSEDSVTVAEISSFQLETMHTFKPCVSAILNITPDHIDRHKTMETYIEMKKSIAALQDEDDFCVLNYEDEILREFGETLKCKAVFFSSARVLEDGLFYKNGAIYMSKGGKAETLCDVRELNLVGMHNYENVMAAAAMADCIGIPLDIIREVVRDFHAVEHRIEFTAEKNGIRYYNDSKGTNTDAAIKAVLAMPSSTVLIAGGYDKNADYDEWIDAFKGRVKHVVLIGQTREIIAKACESKGFHDYRFADNMEEAVRMCNEVASHGDCVLLSPACASWGMFDNYQQRGRIFKECVNKL